MFWQGFHVTYINCHDLIFEVGEKFILTLICFWNINNPEACISSSRIALAGQFHLHSSSAMSSECLYTEGPSASQP